jgi:hypothetical protein
MFNVGDNKIGDIPFQADSARELDPLASLELTETLQNRPIEQKESVAVVGSNAANPDRVLRNDGSVLTPLR